MGRQCFLLGLFLCRELLNSRTQLTKLIKKFFSSTIHCFFSLFIMSFKSKETYPARYSYGIAKEKNETNFCLILSLVNHSEHEQYNLN